MIVSKRKFRLFLSVSLVVSAPILVFTTLTSSAEIDEESSEELVQLIVSVFGDLKAKNKELDVSAEKALERTGGDDTTTVEEMKEKILDFEDLLKKWESFLETQHKFVELLKEAEKKGVSLEDKLPDSMLKEKGKTPICCPGNDKLKTAAANLKVLIQPDPLTGLKPEDPSVLAAGLEFIEYGQEGAKEIGEKVIKEIL